MLIFGFGFLFGIIIGVILVIHLSHKYPYILQRHVWFDISPEFEQDIVTIFKGHTNMIAYLLPCALSDDGENIKFNGEILRVVFHICGGFKESANSYLNRYVISKLNNNDLSYIDCGVY
jgi:hypothetical protein